MQIGCKNCVINVVLYILFQGLEQLKAVMEENLRVHKRCKSYMYNNIDPAVSKMIDTILSEETKKKTFLTLQEVKLISFFSLFCIDYVENVCLAHNYFGISDS